MLELKWLSGDHRIGVEDPYNRTMLELKYYIYSSCWVIKCAYNRTMLELKYINQHLFIYVSFL